MTNGPPKGPNWPVPLPQTPEPLPPSSALREKLLQAALHTVVVKKTPSGAALLISGVLVTEGEADEILDLCLKVRHTVGEGFLKAAAIAQRK